MCNNANSESQHSQTCLTKPLTSTAQRVRGEDVLQSDTNLRQDVVPLGLVDKDGFAYMAN